MPFINGKYVPDDSPEAKEKKLAKEQAYAEKELGKEQAHAEKERIRAEKQRMLMQKREQKKKGKQQEPELTPEQLEEIEREKQRQIEESARRFEELIANDTPDLTNLNKLIEDEKKKAKNPIRKNSKGVTFVLTVILVALLGLMFAAISFASGDMLVAVLALILLFSVLYFVLVPRQK